MPLLGFSMGTSGGGEMGKSLDDIISDRRKEQAKASSGRNVKDGKNKTSNAKDKKNAVADRSIGAGRAKRAAAARARRGLSNNGDAKPSAMEVEKEVYRQARKTKSSKKNAEKKASNGRLPPNSSLREKKNTRNSNNKKTNSNNNSMDGNANDPPGVFFGRIPQQRQIKAAIQGMEEAGCPVPEGFQLVMQFSPSAVQEKGKKPNKNSNKNRNNNDNKNNDRNGNGNNNNNNGGRRRSGRGQRN